MKCDYCKEDFQTFNGVVIYKKHSKRIGTFCSLMCAYNFQGERIKKIESKGVKVWTAKNKQDI